MASRGVDRLRRDVESFQSELMEEFYRNYAGLKDDLSTVEIYDKYAHLFSEDSMGVIRARMDEEPVPDDMRWLRYLRAFTTMGHLDNAVKVLSDRASTFETTSVVEVDGEKVPYRQIPSKLRNEPDREKRSRLFEGKLVETAKLNEMLLEKVTSVHDLSLVLGFKNYRDLCASVKGIDYRALEERMEELLRRTEDIYVRAMAGVLRETAGLELADAWSYDIPYAFRGQEFDKYFAKEKLAGAFDHTLKGMGMDREGYPNIHVDIEERPKKSPRAFCAPVNVPDDIKLVVMPTGGWRDYETFFHEAGHAWHFGNTRKDHPAEYRYLGDNSVTEAFAFLFNYLPSNKLWLRRVLGMEEAELYARFTLVYKLMFLRRYAAKLVYELKLHSGKISPEFQEVYRGCLQKALRFRHTEKHFLEDVDDAFYCAEYLRAWVLEGQLRAALEEEFGEEWFADEKAGAYLKELWSYGQKFNAEEVVKTIGFVDLDVDPLVSEVVRGLED
ncbi:MAG: hypothetical protein A3K67_04710 [Euryarchaeota archaeon RBG_16_62_10]|nr:MAG: hypothetical protein A3K67_04710 [Euryarchaeota archaeon RBG_16_62_10]